MKTFIHYFFTFSFIVIAFTANANSVFDEKNFSKTDTIDAPVITSSQGSYVIACEGDIITLAASEAPDGYGYQWYRGYSYQPIPGATEQELLVTEAYSEDFFVQYTGACPSDFSNLITIFLQAVTTPLIVETPEGYLEVNGAAAYGYDNSYTWYLDGEIVGLESCPGIGYDQWCVQPTESGEYVVCTFYLNIGCSACSESFTYQIPVSVDAPIVTSSHGVNINTCEGDTITLTASEAPDGYGYQWYEGALSDDYQPITDATEQSLQVTEGYGQDFFVQYTGTQPSDFSNSISIFIQEVPDVVIAETNGYLEVQGSAAYYYNDPFTWYLDGEIVELEPCSNIGYGEEWCVQPTQSGNYFVCVDFLKIGCSACSEFFNYIYTNTENITGVGELQISPIPANNVLTINLTTNKQLNLNIKLQNIHGQILIQKQQNISGNWNTSFNINHLPSGTYFLTLQSGNEIMTKKVLMN